ncbi:NAD(P)H-dependent glycerol-3-phosphate dehydrogenase [Niabella ginsengisoli]|uniref:Glycerol-3-phosphate dehydrogenase n=1 Tax=Niabella ginsengisoli TaxID=522298 RepID=A0ABS9SJF2_9BACT|nr:NAD(P)H-dependent glycerol-3-phosphate dehydrogenase [Niabella ginsengisoli]MCH5598494.1 NAD(P)-binding domain-containing protein [Niabella ginsengisoli]
MAIKFGVIGSGSWATALVKILTDNGNKVHWWVRNDASASYIKSRSHNPHYLTSAILKTKLLKIDSDLKKIVSAANVLIVAVPSAFTTETFSVLDKEDLKNKKILSAVKGILPKENVLLNDYLAKYFEFPLTNYFAVLGPCHAEEVAAEKLSYLTFSGIDVAFTKKIASYFASPAINTVVNDDILGVQYAAVLKNIYALGAGIAHGLDYGDNFQSVYIANCADEMAAFLRMFGAAHITVGEHETEPSTGAKASNYAASVYLGDLLVTCYSLYSRNRTFGNMIGKGYSVQAAKLELNMVAEGYNAAKCIYNINKKIKAEMPIADTIYKILWDKTPPAKGFEAIEKVLV